METKVAIVGAILCLLGVTIFAYGIITMNYANAVYSSLTIIVGIFTGMAGLFMLMMQMLPRK